MTLKPRHEAVRVHHQQTNRDEDRGQAHAEGHDQEQAETDPVQGERAEQHDESGGTGNDSACHAQTNQGRHGDGMLAMTVIMLVPVLARAVMVWCGSVCPCVCA